MSILNILLCVGVVNLISPAFGDINPNVKYYNPVAAVIINRDEPSKLCPGAMVWVKHWQVFIGSNTCLTDVRDWGGNRVRIGGNGNAGGNTNDEETIKRMTYNKWNKTLGVGLIFIGNDNLQYEPFPLTSLFMPGILQKQDHDAKYVPGTISMDTWGPHHEVSVDLAGSEMILKFNETLTSNKTCPEELQWGPAMRPSHWGVPLIIGVFHKSRRIEEEGVCKNQLRYTSIIPMVNKWIEKTVIEYYDGWRQFIAKDGKKTEKDYIDHLKKTEKSKQQLQLEISKNKRKLYYCCVLLFNPTTITYNLTAYNRYSILTAEVYVMSTKFY